MFACNLHINYFSLYINEYTIQIIKGIESQENCIYSNSEICNITVIHKDYCQIMRLVVETK